MPSDLKVRTRDAQRQRRSARRVMVALSGGVDSAVAALLLLEQGYDVQGLFMSNWEEDEAPDDQAAVCSAAQDYQDARIVAGELGIVLHRVSFATQYRARVFDDFLREYGAGRTPNPDVLCNREIKFGPCLDYAARLGAALFATGHYARLCAREDGTALYQPADTAKDQTYFLHGVERARFGRVLFPLADLRKSEVRERARRAGLPVHDKPDSTGICFIGERRFAPFLARYLCAPRGPIESPEGRRLGEHRGLPFYTLGQRAGLGLGGARGCATEPWYVARKDPARNALIVVQRHELPRFDACALRTAPLNWLAPRRAGPFEALVRLRHRQPEQPACVRIEPDGGAWIEFHTPQRAATPGQFAVLYEHGRCLGGAVIEQTRLAEDATRGQVASHAAHTASDDGRGQRAARYNPARAGTARPAAQRAARTPTAEEL